MKIKVKTIQGQTLTPEIKGLDLVGKAKEIIAKELNKESQKDEKETQTKRIFPGQLKLMWKEKELTDTQTFESVGILENSELQVLIGSTDKVNLKVKAQLFKSGGVETKTLELTLADTGDSIKDKLIAESFGPADKAYTLFLKGQPVLDNRTLTYYDVDNGSIILVGIIMK